MALGIASVSYFSYISISMPPSKQWINIKQRSSKAFAIGIRQFLDWAFEMSEDKTRIRCPCGKCRNTVFSDRDTIRYHIFIWGFHTAYTFWDLHGETAPLTNSVVAAAQVGEGVADELDQLLQDADFHSSDIISGYVTESPNADACNFYALLRDVKQGLYPGCDDQLTKLSYVVKMLHQKSLHNWTNRSVDTLLKFQKLLLPPGALVPDSYYDAKKIVSQLGLHYVKIDACPNDCILYWRQFEKAEICPTCGEARWKAQSNHASNSNGLSYRVKAKVAKKTLRYFPITERLQRLYMSRKTAKDMRWHKEENVDNGLLKHPADSTQWKTFDTLHPQFATDPRSVRLGLASDGFNPFGNMSTSYSIWPVVVVPYNLPPWLCMKEPFLMMALLIPGKSSPGNDIDVYLQPLIEELKHLWDVGVETFDAHSQQNFQLHAAVIWTINDFPAYGNLSGWVTKGKLACPYCNKDAAYYSLRSKIGYMGHRRFLPKKHRWRADAKSFDGTKECRDPPHFLSGAEVLQQVEQIDNFVHGKKNKRKRDEGFNWSKKSIFFDLPYWKTLLVRHNLDVMHIERNVSESILATLMGVSGRTKDTIKARADLVDLGIRKELHPYEDRGEVRKPNAVYNLSPAEKMALCEFLNKLTVPDGLLSNIARCVNVKDRKISGMKCHDHHILIERFLPFIASGLLRKDVAEPLIELSIFFRDLCNRALAVDSFDEMQKRLAITMCKLEKIFPPAFFDVMMHLPIHLVTEARIAGPVQYRWMYPIERYLRTLKSYVRTNARPEGSIAEGYMVDECLTFCSRYINTMETKFTKAPLNDGCNAFRNNDLSIFKVYGQPRGASKPVNLTKEEFTEVWTYILQNCDEVFSFIEEHKDNLVREGVSNVNIAHRTQFAEWFYNRVCTLHNAGEAATELFEFAMGPHQLVHRYDTFLVNGFKFHTKGREANMKCQNSGVVVKVDHSSLVKEYYGVLTDIYKVQFIGNKELYIFKCHWWDVARNGVGYKVDKWGVTWLNKNRTLCSNEVYVLASQCEQVYYISGVRADQWIAVARNYPRDVYAIPMRVRDEDPIVDMTVDVEAYQEDRTFAMGGFPIDVADDSNNHVLLRNDFDVERFDARLEDVIPTTDEEHDTPLHESEDDTEDGVDDLCEDDDC